MKRTIIIILTILPFLSLGQRVNFNNEIVDTILISSTNSFFNHEKGGISKGISEIILIKFEKEKNQYIIGTHFRLKHKFNNGLRRDKYGRKVFMSEIGKSVDSKDLTALFTTLITPVKKKELFKQIDTTLLKKFLSINQIRKVATMNKFDREFKKKYFTNEENAKFLKSLISIDTIKVYLSERIDTSAYKKVHFQSNIFNIHIYTLQADYRFEGNYPNPVKQPWYYHQRIPKGYK